MCRRASPSIGCSWTASRKYPTDMWQRVGSRYLPGALSVIGGLTLWELVSRLLVANALFLAAPTQIVEAIYTLTLDGQMGRHVAVSSAEFALGYVIASLLGIAVGLGM